jgi:hypothetical protein
MVTIYKVTAVGGSSGRNALFMLDRNLAESYRNFKEEMDPLCYGFGWPDGYKITEYREFTHIDFKDVIREDLKKKEEVDIRKKKEKEERLLQMRKENQILIENNKKAIEHHTKYIRECEEEIEKLTKEM